MDKREAIEFLEKKVSEIDTLKELSHTNQGVIKWRNSIEDILEVVFGRTSTEFNRFYNTRLSSKTWGTARSKQSLYVNQLRSRKTVILSIIQKYKILGFDDTPNDTPKKEENNISKSPIELFDAMRFHHKVVEASRKLFADEYYRDAIYRAFVELNNYVKKQSGLPAGELRGLKESQLMPKVFDCNNPLIKLNELITETDISEQEGFRYLFMGATIGIRNPKAHENTLQDDPYLTLEYLALASLLMRRVEKGKKVKSQTRKPKLNEATFTQNCNEDNHQNAIVLYQKAKNLRAERKGDFSNWGVSGYSYRMPWKNYPNGETIFTALNDGKLTIWPDLLERTGEIGNIYLNKLRNMPIFANEFRKQKYPTVSTDNMDISDIDMFIAAIKELGENLDKASREQ